MTSIDKEHPQYLDEPESRRLEFKERLPKGNQLARTAVAFANGAGGKIVLGVRDSPREIIGIAEDKLFALEERINSSIFDQCAPTIVPEVYLQSVTGKTLLVVEIFPGSNKPYYLKSKRKHNGTYVRIGSSNRKASLEMIEELERRRRKISFDSLPVYDLSPDEIDLKRFERAFKERSGKRLKGDLIKNLGLFHTERDRRYPKNAAILLSDSQARKQSLPYAKIECARFKGSERRVFLDQATIDEPIFASIEPCMTFIKKNIALGSTIGEIYREDRWEYPMEAIREALINAVIHRDYSILGSDIKVAIYDDMLEITSPGPLPDLLSFEELGTGRSEIRNRVLAPIFKDMKLIEAWGSGIQKMRMELKEYPEIELVLKEAGHAFQVQFVKKGIQGTKQEPSRNQVGTKKGLSRDQVGAKQGPSKEMPISMRKLNNVQFQLLKLCRDAKAVVDLMKVFNRSNRTKFKRSIIEPLMDEGLLEMTEPNSPKSPTQKYQTTAKGRQFVNQTTSSKR